VNFFPTSIIDEKKDDEKKEYREKEQWKSNLTIFSFATLEEEEEEE
jgi:hypothetical protein